MRARLTALSIGIAALLCLGAGTSAGARTVDVPCKATQLQGQFTLVPGSAGAATVVYALVLQNRSRSRCFVSGVPNVRLIGTLGRPIETHVVPANRGAGTAVIVRLRPGARAKAEARFSASGCGLASRWLRVTFQANYLTATIVPPTPVCNNGTLRFSVYQAG